MKSKTEENRQGSVDLKFSREQGFFDRSNIIRWLIILGFIISTFIMLNFREYHVDIPEVGSLAPRYIVAQVNSAFKDDEATSILKQEAVRDIGKIYKITEKSIHHSRNNLEKGLLTNEDWKKQLIENTEATYRSIDSLTRLLAQLRFTDPRTIQKMKEYHLPTNDILIFTPNNLLDPMPLPTHIWHYVKQYLLSQEQLTENDIQFALNYFQTKSFAVEEDIPSQKYVRKSIQQTIPDKYSFISAGNRIIDQGETVTPRHVAILQAMKQVLSDNRNVWNPIVLLGSFVMASLLIGICAAYARINYPHLLASNRNLVLLLAIVVLTFTFAKLVEFYLLSVKTSLYDLVRYPLFIPFAAILTCNLLNASIATFVSGFLTVILTMTLAFDRTGFLIVNLTTGLVVILTTHSLLHRKEIFTVCAKGWLVCIATIFSFNLYENTAWSMTMVNDIFSTGIFMLITAVFSIGLLPLLESTFQIMTDVALMEYMDPNLELLRRLSIEAPGTYQHSLVVGSLGEASAVAIGANGLFCRVATLFHDVGKITTSQYFTENQQNAMNIHHLLTPTESAQAIISHVAEGVVLARKAALPEQFIDIIKEHHGTSLAYYFYRKQLDLVNGDKSQVNEKDFRYAGPKPRSKESAIIMIADSFEAASRSLEVIDENSLTSLINRLVREKAEDGQFDECSLTFEEMNVIKKMMVKTLLASGHTRIKYPLVAG